MMKEIRLSQVLQLRDDNNDSIVAVGQDGILYEWVYIEPDGSHVIRGRNRHVWKRVSMELHPDDAAKDEAREAKEREAASNIPF